MRRKTDINKTKCPVCNKELLQSPHGPVKKYCGRECEMIAQISNKKSIFSGEIKKCTFCEKPFSSPYVNSSQKYCSEECRVKAQEHNKPKIIKERRQCEYCGKTFIWSSSKPGQKYCSRECAYSVQRDKSKTFQKNKSEKKLNEVDAFVTNIVTDLITRAKERGAIFCGREINYWEIGDISDKTRNTVLARDDYQCRICTCDMGLHLHHIIKRRNGGDHSEENLITLCSSCHRHIETGDIDHAIKKCVKNRRKYLGLGKSEIKETKAELISNSLYILRNLYADLMYKLPDDTEALIRLDTVISNLESLD